MAVTATATPVHRRAVECHTWSVVVVAVLVLVALGAGLLAVRVWLSTQNRGSGVVAGTRSVAPFNGVELAGDNIVEVRAGAKQSVVVHAQANMLDRVTTRVLAGTLVIATAPGRGTIIGPMSVTVDVPSLKSLSIAPSGSGIITATSINVPSLTVGIAGSGLLRASGTVTRLDVSLGGSGDVELAQLRAHDVRAVLSGSGQMLVSARADLDASLKGNGMILYAGSPPHVTTTVTGSGEIVPG
jgi:Putative auto-transporter adhesin, head GIN domain